MHTACCQRRGTAYAFFLMTAMLVAIIGMTGLSVAGLELRAAQAVNDRIAAETYAEAGVDLGLVALYRTASWRDNIPADTWSTPVAVGDGTSAWKIAPLDGVSFTGNRNGTVRVYGRGICGDATWLYSEVVQPPAEELMTSRLSNGGLESGDTSPWSTRGGCTLVHVGWQSNSGAACMMVTGRTAGSATVQSVTGLSSGARIEAVAAVRIYSGSGEPVWLRLRIRTAAGWEEFEIASADIGSEWTVIRGSTTPTWTGEALETLFAVGTDDSFEFYLDDAEFRFAPGPPGPVPGTWQREAN